MCSELTATLNEFKKCFAKSLTEAQSSPVTVAKGLTERVERLVEAVGSQNGFALAAGVSSAAVSNWRRGVTPFISTLHEVAENLGVSQDWLIYGKGNTEREVEALQARLQVSPPQRKQTRTAHAHGAPRATSPPHSMISEFSERGGAGGSGPAKEDPGDYTASDQTARILSDRTISEIIDEITGNDQIPAEERLRRVRPFQEELSRRIKSKTNQ